MIAELDFKREAIVQLFQSLWVATPGCLGAVERALEDGLGDVVDEGDELHARRVPAALVGGSPSPSSRWRWRGGR